jgi:GNAT superfamily N-acetyltransferase
MLVRPRTDIDLPELERLATLVHNRDGYPAYLPGEIREFLVSQHALGAWVAESNDEIVGHVALHSRSWGGVMRAARKATGVGEASLAAVARLLVSPSARRQGIGHALLEAAAAEACRLGRRPILDVDTTLAAAVSLYESAGWVRIGTVEFPLPDGRQLTEHIYLGPDRNQVAST